MEGPCGLYLVSVSPSCAGPPDALAGPNGAVIDHRGNTPLFNITRACVIKDLAIDMTGFKARRDSLVSPCLD